MEHLSKLFGSPARVKLLRLFLFNAVCTYDRDSVVLAARVTPETASKELAALTRAGIVHRKTFYKEVQRPGSKAPNKRKTLGYVLNQKYPHLDELNRFLRDTLAVSETEIRKRLQGVGTVKLLVLGGFLISSEESVLDMLIVGDRLKEKQIQAAVRALESECGQEIRYALLSTDDYKYRKRIRDKLVRDVMDYPHKEVLNKLLPAVS